ncbi:MAG: phosphatase PAP2 family protein [Simkania negevensis]|nr:phosphatase PAP2 family protein [Simkania negevensis]
MVKLQKYKPFFFPLLLVGLAILAYLFIDIPLVNALFPYETSDRSYRLFFEFLSLLILPPLHLFIWLSLYFLSRFISKLRFLSLNFFEIALAQCITVVLSRILKVIIGRMRPDIFIKEGSHGFNFFSFDSHFQSFPSGHTMSVFALAFSLIFLYPRYRFLFFFAACLLSSSRIFLLDHYLSDVLGSILISFGVAKIVHIVIKKTLSFS